MAPLIVPSMKISTAPHQIFSLRWLRPTSNGYLFILVKGYSFAPSPKSGPLSLLILCPGYISLRSLLPLLRSLDGYLMSSPQEMTDSPLLSLRGPLTWALLLKHLNPILLDPPYLEQSSVLQLNTDIQHISWGAIQYHFSFYKGGEQLPQMYMGFGDCFKWRKPVYLRRNKL